MKRCANKFITPFLLVLLLASPLASHAGITRFDIESMAPSPDGDNYVTLTGTAYGELDPDSDENSIIQDLDLAPRNVRGKVEYATRFAILRPSMGSNGVLLYDAVSHGNRNAEHMYGDLPRKRGYTLVWSGWQGDLLPAPGRLTIEVPVASDTEGSITGRVRTEYVVTAATASLPLSSGPFTHLTHRSYETTSLDVGEAVLTRRRAADDVPEVIANDKWAFADCSQTAFPGVPSTTHVCHEAGFSPEYVYELSYTAKNPLVLGLGLAATRDLIEFLRHTEKDDYGNDNPLASMVNTAIAHGSSQGGRFLRTFLHLGFNADEAERIVFEGMHVHLATGRVPVNVRFGQPGRGYGQREDHRFPGFQSPLTYYKSKDEVAEPFRNGWILERCHHSQGTCPKIVQTVSSTEYWQAHASLNTTDAEAMRDLDFKNKDDHEFDPQYDHFKGQHNVRVYLLAGTQHMLNSSPGSGVCKERENPNSYVPYLRAQLHALEGWLVDGRSPLPNRVPRLDEGTLLAPQHVTWPDVPGLRLPVAPNALTLLDRGELYDHEAESGVASEPPTVLHERVYAVRVPAVDTDGNEVAGIRSTAMQAPLGTYTGWNLRSAGHGEDELCARAGSYFPFADTPAEREAAGDPRPSLEERYGDHAGYVAAVAAAADRLVVDRFLLAEDRDAIVAEAEASDVLTAPIAENFDPRVVRRIVFGSCSNEIKPQPIWTAMVNETPDVYAYLGDNIYADTQNMDSMRADYATLGAQAGYQAMRSQTQVVATWDDHDFGQNDVGKNYPKKVESKQIMLDFFGEPTDSPRRTREGGIYASYTYGPEGQRVQLILLDTRWDRDDLATVSGAEAIVRNAQNMGPYDPDPNPAKRMLGEVQWTWLRAQLETPADVRIIGMSIPFLHDFTGWETWANLPYERERLIGLIRDTGANGVVFVSGDTHWAEFSRREDAATPYPLWDMTTSGLTEEWLQVSPNANRVNGLYYPLVNYGLVDIDWDAPDPEIRMEVRNLDGLPVLTQTVLLSELQITP